MGLYFETYQEAMEMQSNFFDNFFLRPCPWCSWVFQRDPVSEKNVAESASGHFPVMVWFFFVVVGGEILPTI